MTARVWLLLITGGVILGGCHLVFPFNVEQTAGADAGAPDLGSDGPTVDGLPVRDGPRPDLQPPDTAGPLAEGGLLEGGPSSDVAKVDTVPADSGPCPTACVWGCDPTGSCKGFWPANTNSMALSAVKPLSCGSLILSSVSSFDTKKCRVFTSATPSSCVGQVTAQPAGSNACYFYFKNLNIMGTVKVHGSLPLILLVEEMAVIDGVLFAGAAGHEAGPGGSLGGKVNQKGDGPGGGQVCACTSAGADDCGGGGGGYASAGGPGSAEGTACVGSTGSTVNSPGGAVYGKASLSPLEGGSGGAAGHYGDGLGPPGLGGGGGGAVQISAQSTISIKGAINAGGGGGRAASVGMDPRAGGGGGSGGAVLLEAPTINGGGWVAVNGGGGAAGAKGGSGCQHGDDAHPSNLPAKGGNPASVCTAGGIGAVASVNGGPAAAPTSGLAGAGGGGGVGRIRLNQLGAMVLVLTSGSMTKGSLAQIPTP